MKRRLKGSLFGLIFNQFIEFIPYYIAAFCFLYGTHYVQSMLPFYAKELADVVDVGHSHIDVTKFFLLALGIVFFRTSSRLSFFYPARVLQKKLRLEILTLLENRGPTRYSKFTSGELFQILSNAMEDIRALLGFALLQVANIVFALIVLVPKIIEYNDKLLIAILPMFICFLIFMAIVSTNKTFFRKAQDLMADVQNFIMESYLGKQTVKNYHSEGPFIDLFSKYSLKELLNGYKASFRISISLPFIPLGVGLSLLWGAYIIRAEDLGASALVLFSGFVFLFLEPIAFLAWIGVVFARAGGAWSKIRKLISALDEESEVEKYLAENNKDLNEKMLSDGTLFLNVDYWNERISIPVKRAKWTVLVGKTGCGKTEVLKQVAEILKQHNTPLSYVAQTPYLYNDNIINNIFLGREFTQKQEDLAFELLKAFGLDYLESSREGLFNMEIGENGKRLSGGQAKRLCLVRSIMSEAEFLVWDDPFSAVDLILEKEIIAILKSDKRINNKTIILSSHRLSTVKLSDEVIYLEKEKGIIENGESLLLTNKKSKIYEYFENQMV